MCYEGCSDHGHLIKKVKSPSEMKSRPFVCAIQMRSQDDHHDLEMKR